MPPGAARHLPRRGTALVAAAAAPAGAGPEGEGNGEAEEDEFEDEEDWEDEEADDEAAEAEADAAPGPPAAAATASTGAGEQLQRIEEEEEGEGEGEGEGGEGEFEEGEGAGGEGAAGSGSPYPEQPARGFHLPDLLAMAGEDRLSAQAEMHGASGRVGPARAGQRPWSLPQAQRVGRALEQRFAAQGWRLDRGPAPGPARLLGRLLSPYALRRATLRPSRACQEHRRVRLQR
jgi:hypothetical protein